jgi:hypothetical protein
VETPNPKHNRGDSALITQNKSRFRIFASRHRQGLKSPFKIEANPLAANALACSAFVRLKTKPRTSL